ncbi:MAG TPA: PHB depolymerase family esterase [Polyangiaceae bacterium]|nr:PHB depolymerase family esterase [Polyangiaceae bacterium]
MRAIPRVPLLEIFAQMRGYRNHVAGLLVSSFGALAAATAQAASLQPVSDWGASGVPTYISMYIYVPDKLATKPPILVLSHYCGGSASAVFGQAQTGGIVSAADQYGFIIVVPQTTNAATSAKCWEVGSTKSLTHDGGGDTQAVAQMVKYTISKYSANANRVYATGDSSGGMMTEALLAVYPEIFKAGSSFAGVPAGCWSAGWSAASNWGGTCAGGNYTQTAQQWGDKVRAMYPGYSGHRPRVQLVHGDADSIISYKNLTEGVKEWTNVLGLSTNPTATDTGLTLGSHQATRQKWQNSCGYVVLETITSLGGDHGPSDGLFKASYVIPFLGLDKVGDTDPEIAQCSGGAGGVTGTGGSGGGSGGAGGASSATGGNGGKGGTLATGGRTNTGGQSGGGAQTTGGQGPTGGAQTGGGSLATGGTQSTGGSLSTGGTTSTGGNLTGGAVSTGGNSSTGGVSNSGGSMQTGGASGGTGTATGGSAQGGMAVSGAAGAGGASDATSGCSCRVGRDASSGKLSALLLGVALLLRRRRRG